MSYPIIKSGSLEPPPRRGLLGLGRRYRDGSEVPKADAHHVLVYRVDGDYLVDRGRLRLDDEQVLNATFVSVVDMRLGAPVVVEIPVPSRDASQFTMRVTFGCTVKDPLAVVRNGIDAQTLLGTYLRSHHRIFEIGLAYEIGDINEVRRSARAQVTAYFALSPPVIPGLNVAAPGTEVLTPDELVQLEEESRKQRRSHRLAAEQQRLKHNLDAGTELSQQELADIRARYQRDSEYEQLQHEQLISTDRQRHDQLLEAERSEFRRRELGKAWEMLGDDPKEALQQAYQAGQLDAYLSGQSDAAQFGEHYRGEREQERALEAAKEDRERAERFQRRREEREDRIQELRWQREDRAQEFNADREDKRWAHEAEQRRGELERQDKLQQLLWEREDALRRETEERKDTWRRLDLNLELLKVLAGRGHADMVNLNIDRIIDQLAPGAKAEEVTVAARVALAPADAPSDADPVAESADQAPDIEVVPEPDADADLREEDDTA